MDQVMINNVELTSLELASLTEKRHSDIMRDIRNEIEKLGDELGQRIFAQSSYFNTQRKEQPMYVLGKKGAMQLALKYDAMTRYKVIQRIEELEESTKMPPISKELQAILMIDRKQGALENRMQVLENTSVIDHRQQLEINNYAKAKVVSVLGGIDSNAYADGSVRRKTFQAIWRDYKDYMQVSSYKDTPKVELETGKAYIDQWSPGGKITRLILIANGEI